MTLARSPIARTGTLNRKTPLPREAAPTPGKPRARYVAQQQDKTNETEKATA